MTVTKIKNGSMSREFIKFVIPAIISMVVTSMYSIIDGIFVGRGVGENALAAVNIAYPLIMLHIALAMLVAIGGANAFSINKGRGDIKNANRIFLQSMILIVGISAVLNVLILVFPTQVSRLLGADDMLLPYVRDYIKWVALFAVIYMPGLALSIFIRNDGAPKREMTGTLIGAVTNIVLDYLFIMVFDMGVSGAAIATGIGQLVSTFIFMTHFTKKNRLLKIEKVKFYIDDIKYIFINGSPSFLMEFSQAAVAFSFNIVLLSRIGALGVSAYSIVMYICSIFNMILIGLVQGIQPIMSFNYGKGNRENIQKVYKMAVRTSLCLTVIVYIAVFIFGKALSDIFIRNNAQVTNMALNMMRYYFLAFFPIGISLINILYFQIIRHEKWAVFLSFIRCIGFVQLSLLIMPELFGITGIFLSFLCGELANCFISVILYKYAEKSQSNTVKISDKKVLFRNIETD
ncbi:MATE family efflux transporter [Sebaldella termitidis]|uniref:MATE family efflux transporter n=1 Tax=Sebaldella termitidis TaxID=826 RepID=UPI003EB72144